MKKLLIITTIFVLFTLVGCDTDSNSIAGKLNGNGQDDQNGQNGQNGQNDPTAKKKEAAKKAINELNLDKDPNKVTANEKKLTFKGRLDKKVTVGQDGKKLITEITGKTERLSKIKERLKLFIKYFEAHPNLEELYLDRVVHYNDDLVFPEGFF